MVLMVGEDATNELQRNVADLARSLFVSGTVSGTLQRTVDLAVATVEGCDAAGVFLADDQEVVTAAASAPLVVELDALQISAGEGPCLEVVAEGGTVHVADLADILAGRRSVPAAVAAGVRSTLAGIALDTDRAKALIFATGDQAFDVLRRASQHLNIKIREVARTIVETGETPPTRSTRPR